jgi:hypothetical protein
MNEVNGQSEEAPVRTHTPHQRGWWLSLMWGAHVTETLRLLARYDVFTSMSDDEF